MIRTAAVIGAGIGGLAVAALLARRGVSVTVFEQAAEISEVGAGLQVSPNGLCVLRSLELEPELLARHAVRAQAVQLLDYRAGRPVARLDLTRLDDEARYYFVHRADLIDVLHRAADAAGVQIVTGQKCETVSGAGFAATGGAVRADLVIGADGLHSVMRPVLNGGATAKFTGQVAWRAIVPNTMDHPAEARVHMGPGQHLVSYPLRDGKSVNLVAVQERRDWQAEGWHFADDPANLRDAFAGFGGPGAALLEQVRQVSVWGLFRHPVAARWHGEGMALLGDAAHPTLPFLAQGANMALEDAWVLADRVIRLGLEEGLPAYQLARRARVEKVILAASGNTWRYHLRPGPLRWAAHRALGVGSALVPGLMLGQFDWLYGHDVTRRS